LSGKQGDYAVPEFENRQQSARAAAADSPRSLRRRACGFARRHWLILTFCLVAALVVAAIASMAAHWEWLKQTPDPEKAPSNFQLVQSIGAGVLALIGMGLAAWRSRETARANNLIAAGNITERFSRAVEQLGSAQMAVRLGAIHALWRLGGESEKDYPTIQNILCAFVRAPTPDEHWGSEVTSQRIREDVQAILTLLGRKRSPRQKELGDKINFSGATLCSADLMNTDLSGANFMGADFSDANLSDSNLSEANFSNAYLSCAKLRFANLSQANLSQANLSNANLSYANLPSAKLLDAKFSGSNLSDTDLSKADLSNAKFSRADLSRADLSKANLSRADLSDMDLRRAKLSDVSLSGANLSRADLSGANLWGSDLSEANLSNANLSRTDLLRADLSNADISGAKFSGANLSRANLSGARNLTQEQLNQAYLFDPTHPPMLPDGFKPPPAHPWQRPTV
jgi:uncharacterized protein YjbI with pentapeptide repeats